jgi:hypothetical protein
LHTAIIHHKVFFEISSEFLSSLWDVSLVENGHDFSFSAWSLFFNFWTLELQGFQNFNRGKKRGCKKRCHMYRKIGITMHGTQTICEG